MCGIAGILNNHSSGNIDKKVELLKNIKTMTDTLAHRGPDGEGHWVNDAGTIAIGHRRLAVIDLTDAAAQPMQRSVFSSAADTRRRE